MLRTAKLEPFERGRRVAEPGTAPSDVVFPISALISIVVVFESGATSEVGVVGSEGFVPVEPAVHDGRTERTAFCQVPGEVLRVGITEFRAGLEERGELFTLVQQNVGARLFAAQQLVGCNVAHSLRERCARWLLMTRDRVRSNEFPLTHDFLALMLGVRRASVTEVAGELQDDGAIRYQRGLVTIVDEQKLAERACECYGAITDAFARALRKPSADGSAA